MQPKVKIYKTKTNSRQHAANPKYRPCYPFSRIYFSTVTAGV